TPQGRVGPEALHRLQMSNVAFTANARNRILIEPGQGNESLADSAALTAQPGLEGYVIKPWNDPTPQLAVPAGITLTVDPGVTVMTAENTPINVVGHLAVEGTAVSPVTFTSITDTLPGGWDGLVISGTASLDHAIIRNGVSNIGLIGAGGGQVSIENSLVENAAGYAIFSDIIALHRLRMNNVSFSGNNPDRVYVYPDDGYVLTGSSELSGQPGLDGYEVNLANFVVPEGITLTLRSGAKLMMKGGVVPVAGHLVASGTTDAPVTFTSDIDSGPGEWAGIVLEGGTAVIDHAQIRNAGKDGQSGVRVGGYITDGGDLTLRNSTIISGTAAGLSVYSGQVTAVCTTFSNNNGDAIYATGSPDVTVFSSRISGNG
ncbi:MAG: right-handed parallel beta-helix repeat-containing protein, partial [Anaerolineae bacterium]